MKQHPHFEVFEQRRLVGRQRWYWRLVAGNGEIVAQSEAYSTQSNAIRGARQLAESLATLANIGGDVDIRVV